MDAEERMARIDSEHELEDSRLTRQRATKISQETAQILRRRAVIAWDDAAVYERMGETLLADRLRDVSISLNYRASELEGIRD